MAEQELVLTIDGDIVSTSSEELKEKLHKAVGEDPKILVLDFKNVEYVDSIGIGIIIATHNSLRNKGAKLKLINVNNDILNLFKTMRLDKHIDMEEA
ncbi:STAS domain-containing protein [Desulfohalobiaceae bacterium Ax17]|uniref:STAS domain-containing protein n=1 Tax=Desulfovulcanus ferrireducens TaxID=2831190 RepID=UPI00207BC7B6|nr:STAS domain-containing protein [Desulfovulcanus ferrireducens]MBT8762496.1 STAS domain-containing protein [Desulfovulcanus ferrireducens]